MHWTRIEEKSVGDVTVLALEGHLTLDGQDRSLRDMVEYLVAARHTRVVLDLQAVPYIDSLGLGEIIRAYSAMMRAGGSLKLARVGQRVHEVLRATQLTKVLGEYESVERAVLSFRLAAPGRTHDGGTVAGES